MLPPMLLTLPLTRSRIYAVLDQFKVAHCLCDAYKQHLHTHTHAAAGALACTLPWTSKFKHSLCVTCSTHMWLQEQWQVPPDDVVPGVLQQCELQEQLDAARAKRARLQGEVCATCVFFYHRHQ